MDSSPGCSAGQHIPRPQADHPVHTSRYTGLYISENPFNPLAPPPPQSPLRRGVIRDGGRGDDGMGEAQQKERVQIREKAMLKGFSHQIRTA
jgi:hypothetical protein